MSEVNIYINTDNAAFCDDKQQEVARILEEAIFFMKEGLPFKNLMDFNGNTVGYFEFNDLGDGVSSDDYEQQQLNERQVKE